MKQKLEIRAFWPTVPEYSAEFSAANPYPGPGSTRQPKIVPLKRISKKNKRGGYENFVFDLFCCMPEFLLNEKNLRIRLILPFFDFFEKKITRIDHSLVTKVLIHKQKTFAFLSDFGNR